ncbi:hypothetical protein BC835DRAFT_1008153 [Cytidiella melzeri]|nr:hypothetical protein BC835DRAFT_1008153 [Cytidiella melzeri]
MPGKVVRQVFIVNNAKPDKAAIQSQCKLNSAPEQTNDPEPKKLRKKTAPKVLRNRIVRPHIVKGRDIQLDDSGGEDVIETDWIAEADGADRPVVHEVQLVELLKPGKPGKPRPRDQQGKLSRWVYLNGACVYVHATQPTTLNSFQKYLLSSSSTISPMSQRQSKRTGKLSSLTSIRTHTSQHHMPRLPRPRHNLSAMSRSTRVSHCTTVFRRQRKIPSYWPSDEANLYHSLFPVTSTFDGSTHLHLPCLYRSLLTSRSVYDIAIL